MDDLSAELSSVSTRSSTAAGQDGATLVFAPDDSMIGNTIYMFADNSSGAIVGAGGELTVISQSPSIDVTDAITVTSETKDLFVDTDIPTNTISSAAYDSDSGVITLLSEFHFHSCARR